MLRKIFHWIISFIVNLTCDLEVIGLDRVPLEGGCIVVSNHLGRMDVFLVFKVLNRQDIILVIAEKYKKIAIFRVAAKAMDGIWIDRFTTDFSALRQIINRLQNGGILVLAPEGTRSKSEALIPGKHGAAYLAMRTKVPIIPVALTGTEDRVVKNRLKKLRRATVTVRIGNEFTLPSISHEKQSLKLQTYTDLIMCHIAALLPQEYRGVYAEHPLLGDLLSESPSS